MKKRWTFKAFTRPQKLTEEEVSLYKEKKGCMAYKSKVERFNVYICPKCDILYCEKCAKILSDLENSCGVCETSIDDSKPIKKIGEKGADISISDVQKSIE